MNSSTPTSPDQAGASPSRLVRIFRSTALLVLAFILTFLVALAVLASTAVGERFADGDPVAAGVTLGCFVVIPIVLVVLASRLRFRARWIGVGYLAVAPVLVYLTIDDPVILHPTTMDEIAPTFPGAEASYAVLMRYSKQTPSEEAKAFERGSPQRVLGMPMNPDKREEWEAFLKSNRAAIEADWADLAPQRRWLEELNRFDRIGDLGEASPDANIITFKVWRLVSQRALHVAGLHMLDGQPDAAVATLLPMLQAGRKLQPAARSLVRFMVGIVVEKMNVLYLTDIVARGGVSPEVKAQIAAALAGGVRGEAGARRMIGIEHAFVVSIYFDKGIGDLLAGIQPISKLKPGVRPVLNAISPLIYNPRRTINIMSDLNRELQDLAARRGALSSPEADRLYAERTRPKFKNFAGPILADLATPAYGKIVKSYWETHDAREKLSAMVAAAPAT